VLGYLQQRGAKKIVAITRDPAKLGNLDGIGVRSGDFAKPASLDQAFSGVERLLIISTGEVGIPGGRHALHHAAIDAAERAGVTHIAYTSITNPYPSPTALVANDHFWTEARMFRFGGTWTALRDNIYTDMLLQSAPRAIASGQLVHASGNGIRAFVTRDDVAATAAGVLLGAEGNEVLDVSGDPVTFAMVAEELGRAAGKAIAPVAIPAEQLVAGMVSAGLPRHLALAFAAFDADTARNLFAVTSDAVRRFAGREPTTLRQFLASQQLAA
jgi:NAD(P)H dehydrogenase (quinone)